LSPVAPPDDLKWFFLSLRAGEARAAISLFSTLPDQEIASLRFALGRRHSVPRNDVKFVEQYASVLYASNECRVWSAKLTAPSVWNLKLELQTNRPPPNLPQNQPTILGGGELESLPPILMFAKMGGVRGGSILFSTLRRCDRNKSIIPNHQCVSCVFDAPTAPYITGFNVIASPALRWAWQSLCPRWLLSKRLLRRPAGFSQ